MILRFLRTASRRSDLLIAVYLVVVIFMMILPLPTLLVDVLIALNIATAVILLMVGVYIVSPLEFTGFPAVLLLTTLSRLALSVTTTRLILLQGDAGSIVFAFGDFVVGGSIIVGLVVFSILTIVQFLVITKGSERVAEVGARFTLDGMPGKQMSIDGDLRAGLIDMDQARSRRESIEKESQLYGAMDGAMKFVKGDAIAGLIIILINLIGGISIGTLVQDMPATEALNTYAILTVGDGLINQIPALIISVTAGLIVTRVASGEETDLGRDLVRQIFTRYQALLACGLIMLVFAALPGFPTLLFLFLSAASLGAGYWLRQNREMPDGQSPGKGEPAAGQPEIVQVFQGTGLPVITDGQLSELQQTMQLQLGVPFPLPAFRQTDVLEPDAWQILLHEIPVASGTIPRGTALACTTPEKLVALGIEAPADGDGTGIPVPDHLVEKIAKTGIPCLTGSGIVLKYLTTVLSKNAGEFIGIQETRDLLDQSSQTWPELVREVQRVLPLQRIAAVYQRLVSEDLSIRNQRSVLEALAEWGPKEKDEVQLAEYVRSNQKRYISHKFGRDGRLSAWMLDEEAEEAVRQGIRITSSGCYLALDPSVTRAFVDEVKSSIGDSRQMPAGQVLITSMDVRRYVRKLIEEALPDLPVLSWQEISPDLQVQPLGRINPDLPRSIPAEPMVPAPESLPDHFRHD